MNSLNDFIEIFGLNINEGDIIRDKQGIEYKLSHIHTEKLDDHENDDLYKEGLGINGDSFELEHTFNEKDILKDDGIQLTRTNNSDCVKDTDIKSLIEHIYIELQYREKEDMFMSFEELIDFLALQIKTFCPAGIYKSIKN